MFPILSEGGSINLAPQQQQHTMRSGDYTGYALPSGSVFTAVPTSPAPSSHRAYMNSNSVLIDPPTTFFVQAQQQQQQQPQKMHAMLSYAHNPSANPIAAYQSASMPFYTTASVEAPPFGSAMPLSALNPATRTQRMGSVLNNVPSLPPHQQQQQQQQRLQPVYLQPTASDHVTPPYQPQRGGSVSVNSSSQYSPLSHYSQPPVMSATPPGSSPGQLTGAVQLHSAQQPLSPLSSSSGVLQASHCGGGGGHHTTASTPPVAFSSPPSSVLQHPQQLVTGMGAVETVNTLAAATGAANAHSHSTAPAAAAVAAAGTCHGVDGEEAQQANERPFRFKMLPPPPTFDRFLQQWEANAADSHYRPWRRSDGATGHVDAAADHGGVLTAEDVLQRSAVAATATVVAGSAGSGGAPRTVEERLALAEQYHRILERWWYYVSIFEQKAEVRQRLGSLYSCPDYADAQRAVAAGFAELLPGEPREQLTQEEVTLQTWSQLVLKWWEETKRRRRTRRSRRGSRKDGTSTSSAAGRSTLEDSQVIDGEATPPQLENDEAESEASGQSLRMPHYQSGRRTRSLTDNEGYLNFDFTNQTTFGSLADSS